MRFSTLFFAALAGAASFVHAVPFSDGPLSDAELAIRDNGDVNILMDRDYSASEIYERDLAFAAASGSEIEARGLSLSQEEVEELVLRHLDLDAVLEGRDLVEYEELNPRIVGIVVQAAKAIAEGVIQVFNLIKGKIEKDKSRRSQFTSDFIKQSRQKYPQWNWVICHTKHKTHFDGKSGKDFHHRHQEFKVSFGKTIGYEIYWFRSGVFERQGDGGYLNWSYGGNIKSKSGNGKKITFGKP